MAQSLTADEKIALIKSQLQEVIKPEVIEDVIRKGERAPVIYWGTATTGRPHAAYFVPMIKLAHFLQAGCVVKILLADIHAFLDNLKAPIELVNHRAEYYKLVIQGMLRAIGVPLDKLEFVLGSSYQLSAKYTMDIFRLSSMVSEHDAKRAGAEVVKQSDNAPLSGLIYPLMQVLDEEFLGVDAQFGGVDQRKIFALANDKLPSIGYRERTHMMNPMVPGLAGGKMSSSDPDSKIDILEPADGVKKKIKKAFAEPKNTDGNGLVSFIEYVLLPVSELQNGGKGKIVFERREGEPLEYDNIQSLKEDYVADKLTPQLLKNGVTTALNELLEPVREAFNASQEWRDIEAKAYPPPEVKKKAKKEKNLGTRFPGANKVEAKPDGHVEGEGSKQANVSSNAAEALKKLDIAPKEAQ